MTAMPCSTPCLVMHDCRKRPPEQERRAKVEWWGGAACKPLVSQGCENGVFGKRCFWKTDRKPGGFDEKWRKWRFAFYPQKQGVALLRARNRRKWRKWRESLRQNHRLPKGLFPPPWLVLVDHYLAICNPISWDTPYSSILWRHPKTTRPPLPFQSPFCCERGLLVAVFPLLSNACPPAFGGYLINKKLQPSQEGLHTYMLGGFWSYSPHRQNYQPCLYCFRQLNR